MVNVTQKAQTLHHHITEKDKVEAKVHFQPPHYNITWKLVLVFTAADNDTYDVMWVHMHHVPGNLRSNDRLHVQCTNIKGKNKTNNNTEVLKPWNNFFVPLQSIKIKASSYHFIYYTSNSLSLSLWTVATQVDDSTGSGSGDGDVHEEGGSGDV